MKEKLENFKAWVAEQEWAQEAKTRWEELDSEMRLWIKMGSAAAAVLLVFGMLGAIALQGRSLRRDLREKRATLAFLQEANDELRRLKEVLPASSAATQPPPTPWVPYLETIAQGAGIDRSAVTYANERAGPAGDFAKETQLDITATRLNIKQIVKLAHGLENGARPVRIRALSIDTKGDPSGYMDVTAAISGFVPNAK